jgi:hypothetical protein
MYIACQDFVGENETYDVKRIFDSEELCHTSLFDYALYLKKSPAEDEYHLNDKYGADPLGDWVKQYGEISIPDREKLRTDPIMIQLVKNNPDQMKTEISDLVVANIPDGYAYEIVDYDGIETIYYGLDLCHKTAAEFTR